MPLHLTLNKLSSDCLQDLLGVDDTWALLATEHLLMVKKWNLSPCSGSVHGLSVIQSLTNALLKPS